MITCPPGIEANGSEHILMAGVGNKKRRDYVDLLSDVLVQAPNRIDAEQKHRGFGDSLLTKEPVAACG
jgi:hypothetical protein